MQLKQGTRRAEKSYHNLIRKEKHLHNKKNKAVLNRQLKHMEEMDRNRM